MESNRLFKQVLRITTYARNLMKIRIISQNDLSHLDSMELQLRILPQKIFLSQPINVSKEWHPQIRNKNFATSSLYRFGE